MSYSTFAWKGFTRYFNALNKTGLIKPISCDTKNALLQVPSKRPVFTWTILTLTAFINGFMIPLVVLGKQAINSNKQDSHGRDPPTFIQYLVLIVFILGSLNQFPIFLHFLYTNSELACGFNHLVQMDKYIRGKFVSCKI